MKTIVVKCFWESTHKIEVPDDFEVTSRLSDFPDEALEEMDSHTAELVDWERA